MYVQRKPIDYPTGGIEPVSNWTRQMQSGTVGVRFGQDLQRRIETTEGVEIEQTCPFCGSLCYVASGPWIKSNGEHAKVYWPQCRVHRFAAEHGYSAKSPYGTRSASGRKPGSKNKGEPEPEPVEPDEPFHPEINAQVAAISLEPEIPAGMVHHERLADLLKLYRAGMRAFLLEGPAGSGKTSLGRDLAKVLGIRSVTVSGCRETEKGELTKRAHPVTGVEKLSYFLAALIDGPCVGVIDEGDGIPPDVLLSLNEPTANRCLTVNGETVHLHEDSVIVLTANATNGSSRVYTGRYPMDGATKSRFFPIFCDYSQNIEKHVCPDATLRAAVTEVRQRVNNDPQLARSFAAMVGTRFMRDAGTVGRAYGLKGRDMVAKALELGNPVETVRQLLG